MLLLRSLSKRITLLLVSAQVVLCSKSPLFDVKVHWATYAVLPCFVLCWMLIVTFISYSVFRSIIGDKAGQPTQMLDWGDVQFERVLEEKYQRYLEWRKKEEEANK